MRSCSLPLLCRTQRGCLILFHLLFPHGHVILFHWIILDHPSPTVSLSLRPSSPRHGLPTKHSPVPSPNSMNATNTGRTNKGSELLWTQCIKVSDPAQFFLHSPSVIILLLSGLHLKTVGPRDQVPWIRSNMRIPPREQHGWSCGFLTCWSYYKGKSEEKCWQSDTVTYSV